MNTPDADATLSTAQKFFESTPPGSEVIFPSAASRTLGTGNGLLAKLPDVLLHCDRPECNGIRSFRTAPGIQVPHPGASNHYVGYHCKNCGFTMKLFAVRLEWAGENNLRAYKYGQFPIFGPTTPARLTKLVGPEREYFLKGRRAESQSMGIAAFAYYRRVIENQRDRIFDAIIAVAEQLGSDVQMIQDLRAAKSETQFSKGVDQIKHGLPQALLINGHNPLRLLHSALSEGLHALTDEQCLELATSIRLVMTELAERLSQAVNNEAELTSAIARLIKPAAAASRPK